MIGQVNKEGGGNDVSRILNKRRTILCEWNYDSKYYYNDHFYCPDHCRNKR